MKAVVGSLLTFAGGFVAALNVGMLTPGNSEYPASWSNVAIAIAIASFGSYMNISKKL